jgi:hypothetical protein
MIKVRALPSRRVMLHADHRYYDPLGLPLPSARFHHRLIPAVFARRRPGRRASPVPAQTVRACHPPYPGGTRQADPGTGPDGHGLRRDMSGSAPPLFLCRGCKVRLMLRPARLLPPKRLLTPRSARRLSTANRGLLPGAPVPTRTGLSPVSLDQLSGRNMRISVSRVRHAPTCGRSQPKPPRNLGRSKPAREDVRDDSPYPSPIGVPLPAHRLT